MSPHRVLAILLVGCLALSAQAAKKDKTKGLPAASTVPEVNQKPLDDAKSALALAQGRLERAQDAFNTLLKHRRDQFETAPALSQAQAAIRDAQSEYDSVAAPILEKVRARTDYQSALDAKKVAAKKVADLQSEASTPQDQITDAARTALDRGAAVSAIERAALEADPKVLAAKGKLAAANTNLLKLRYEFEKSLKADPQVTGSREEIDKLRADLAPLQSAYDAALQDYSRQVAARDKALHDDKPNTTDPPKKYRMKKKKV
jgi:hypothetical protein